MNDEEVRSRRDCASDGSLRGVNGGGNSPHRTTMVDLETIEGRGIVRVRRNTQQCVEPRSQVDGCHRLSREEQRNAVPEAAATLPAESLKGA